jgi:Tol biopolymer transport system component
VLLGQRIDLEGGRLIGRATALVPRVGVAPSGRGFFAGSPRLLLAAAGGTPARDLSWFDATGRRVGPILEPGNYSQVRLSPDDRRVAVTAVDPLLRTLDVFAASLDRPGRLARLSLSLGPDSDPVWSSDGSRVAYRSVARGSTHILTRDAAGADSAEAPLMQILADDTVTDWRGTQLLVQAPSTSGGLDVWMVNQRAGSRMPVARGGFNESAAVWSPDGSRIAYVSDESGQPDVYVVRWPGADQRVRVSFAGGTRPQWGRDGMTLFFMRETRVMRTRGTSDGRELAFSTSEPVLDTPGLLDFAVAHQSDRFAVLTQAASSAAAPADLISGWSSLIPAPPPR